MNKGAIAIALLLVASLGGWYWNATYQARIDSRDSIVSWDFQGSHNDNGSLEERVRNEITSLEAALEDEEKEPTDYAIFVSLSNQHVLLGEGQVAYDFLKKALAIDAEKTGLAWHNVGTLMERLGAYYTARDAYERAAQAQPQIDLYHAAYMNFLVRHFSDDTSAIQSEVEFAEQSLTNSSSIHLIEAQWEEGRGETESAISAYEKARDQMPEEARPDIDAKITQLRAL